MLQVLRPSAAFDVSNVSGTATQLCGKAAKPGTLHGFCLSQRDQDRFIYHLTRAIIIGNVLFTFMENEDMQAAAKIVGVRLPSRKVTSTTLLDSTADEVELPTATR